jgi:hypothetical protein
MNFYVFLVTYGFVSLRKCLNGEWPLGFYILQSVWCERLRIKEDLLVKRRQRKTDAEERDRDESWCGCG